MKKRAVLVALLLAILLGVAALLPAAALAVQPDEILSDSGLEQRARTITKNLRCLVCQGEDIDASEAPLAADLRKLVRERLTAGDSDEAVVRYITDRYGDRVLMQPPVRAETLLLWSAPALVFAAGAWLVFSLLRRSRPDSAEKDEG